jgi:hypothetical protein
MLYLKYLTGQAGALFSLARNSLAHLKKPLDLMSLDMQKGI